MIIKCPKCGASFFGPVEKCTRCGARIEAAETPAPTESPAETEHASDAALVKESAPVTEAPKPELPKPEPEKAASEPEPAHEIKGDTKAVNTEKEEKPKKKKKHGFLKFLLVLAIVIAVLALAWFALGNMLTLYIHSSDVVKTMNSGSLELHGLESDRDELPDYVKDMLGEEKKEENPVVEDNLPYISVRVAKINGFFGGKSVEYAISAPDVEKFFMEADMTKVSSSEELMKMLLAYIPTAPMKERTVTVTYTREGLFGWRGNYKTVAFADAISGGLNSAYNYFYGEMMKDFEEALK